MERDITKLYSETTVLLGIPPIRTIATADGQAEGKPGDSVFPDTVIANKLPSPAEMKDEKGAFIVPNKPCPKCGKTAFLTSICPSCKDSEGGIYKTGYTCFEKECGFVDGKTEEPYPQRLKRMGIEIPQGTKHSLGIKTLTNEGLK